MTKINKDEILRDPSKVLSSISLGLNSFVSPKNTKDTLVSPKDLLDWYFGTVDEKEAARLTGFSTACFQRHRWNGSGPPFSKTGNRVRYQRWALLQWVNSSKDDK